MSLVSIFVFLLSPIIVNILNKFCLLAFCFQGTEEEYLFLQGYLAF